MHGILDKVYDLINSYVTREDIFKKNLELRYLCGYSSIEEFVDDLWEFKAKWYYVSYQETKNQTKIHPKAIYTSRLISDLTKNVQWESNESVRGDKYESAQKMLEINF
ncbi:14591_t:CDS:2 [Acaulospora morrowiae]|uniref:14591_t:CDS:1 n=1 Tax=Acaulospora morrowiae TaxID=94023 RepID=A0A9N8ZPK1_9GLOM|nr:14591_t:CDS:2 [Acaulospora morrowiae]